MKIAIVGTHGTGKTTLCFKLASHYKSLGKNVKVVQEVARSCPFPINEGMTAEAALWIYYEQARKELEAEKDHDVVVCDRSVYDPFVYGYHFGLYRPALWSLSSIANYSLRFYHKLIWVRPDMKIEPDGIRALDESFQTSIDEIFQEHLIDREPLQIKSSQIFDKEESWKQFCL